MDGVYIQSGGPRGPVFIDWRIIYIEAKAEKISCYSHHGDLLDGGVLNFDEHGKLILSHSIQIYQKAEGAIILCLNSEKSDELQISYEKIQKTDSPYNSEELGKFPIQFLDIGGVKFYKKKSLINKFFYVQ